MNIRIAARMHPLSHTPGTLCLLPQTHLKLQIFPTRIQFFNCADQVPLFFFSLDIQGPLKEFTIEMDLEHQHIKIFGMTSSGYLRYILRRQSDGIGIIMEKLPQPSVVCHLSLLNQTYQVFRGETLLIPTTFIEPPSPPSERLSLGMHKKQDWDLVKRRCDLKEIFPIWMRLGQVTPPVPHSSCVKNNLSLLQKCEEIVSESRKQDVTSAFKLLFLAAFEGILVPRLFDRDYQGIVPIEIPEPIELSPIFILTQSAKLIRSLFLQENNDIVTLLPVLPPDFHSGRMLDVYTRFGDRIDFEWTKKQLRCISLHPCSETRMSLQLSKRIRKCRMRRSLRDKGQELLTPEGVLVLDLYLKHPIFLDRFEK